MDGTERRRDNTDIAALSAGVIAVVVSLFIAPGPYDIESLVISFSLVVIIFGYVWTNPRWWLQSLAVATAIALASLPGAGFIYETARSESPVAYLVGEYSWDCKSDPCSADGECGSRVHPNDIALAWFGTSVAILIIDLFRQRKIRGCKKL